MRSAGRSGGRAGGGRHVVGGQRASAVPRPGRAGVGGRAGGWAVKGTVTKSGLGRGAVRPGCLAGSPWRPNSEENRARKNVGVELRSGRGPASSPASASVPKERALLSGSFAWNPGTGRVVTPTPGSASRGRAAPLSAVLWPWADSGGRAGPSPGSGRTVGLWSLGPRCPGPGGGSGFPGVGEKGAGLAVQRRRRG